MGGGVGCGLGDVVVHLDSVLTSLLLPLWIPVLCRLRKHLSCHVLSLSPHPYRRDLFYSHSFAYTEIIHCHWHIHTLSLSHTYTHMDTGPGVHSFLRYCAKTTLACFCILNMFALCWCVLVCVWMQWVPLMSLDSSGPWRVTSWCMDGFVVLSLFYLFFLPKSQICVCLKDFYAIIMLLLTHIHIHKPV